MEVRSKINKFRDFLSGGERFVAARKRSLGRLCFYRRLSVHGGEAVSVLGGLSRRPPLNVTVMCGRYASYWNAFLFWNFSITSHNQTRKHSSRMCSASWHPPYVL